MGYGYHRKSGELRLRQEKEHTGQGPREGPDAEFPGVLFLQSQTHHFPDIDCDRTRGGPPTRAAPLSPGVQNIQALIRRNG